jgi:hypothetical protein
MTGDDEAIAMNVDEAASLQRLVERLGRLDVEPPKDWAKKERGGEWATIAGLIGGVAGVTVARLAAVCSAGGHRRRRGALRRVRALAVTRN